jgi:hypothetical protein
MTCSPNFLDGHLWSFSVASKSDCSAHDYSYPNGTASE